MTERTSSATRLISLVKRQARFACILLILFVLLGGIIVASFIPLSQTGFRVSNIGMKEYAETYCSEYRKLVEDNMPILDEALVEGRSQSGSHNLTFYWQPPDSINCVISRTHGAAIIFNQTGTNILQISVVEFQESIEYYFWPGMPKSTTNLPIVRILKGFYDLDSPVINNNALLYVDPGAILRYTGDGRAFRIAENGAIIVFGSIIERDRLTLKGSNNKEDWSGLQARFDALSVLLWDCKGILNETSLKKLENTYKPTLLIERIGGRVKSGAYKNNPSLFRDDFEDLRDVGASNETLQKVLDDFYDMQKESTPTWYEELWVFLKQRTTEITVGLFVTIVGAVIVKIIENKYLKPRRSSRAKKDKTTPR